MRHTTARTDQPATGIARVESQPVRAACEPTTPSYLTSTESLIHNSLDLSTNRARLSTVGGWPATRRQIPAREIWSGALLREPRGDLVPGAVECSQVRHARDGRAGNRAGCRVSYPGHLAHFTPATKHAGIRADGADKTAECDELAEEVGGHLASIRLLTCPPTSPKGLPPCNGTSSSHVHPRYGDSRQIRAKNICEPVICNRTAGCGSFDASSPEIEGPNPPSNLYSSSAQRPAVSEIHTHQEPGRC